MFSPMYLPGTNPFRSSQINLSDIFLFLLAILVERIQKMEIELNDSTQEVDKNDIEELENLKDELRDWENIKFKE